MHFYHPWYEIIPFSQIQSVQKFIRVTRYHTWAGISNYDSDVYKTWCRQRSISLELQMKNKPISEKKK